ncbi:MAG: nitrous oxide reductase family maturation protein NosD [Bacteroidetes bacterium]|nr:nitrous oxide reductase family maturation protein NosD [Bacteroidota bacterium]MBS1539609.1 nitrous oxide reductase family maturation protein NosD [Bacteroidota bacterium]
MKWVVTFCLLFLAVMTLHAKSTVQTTDALLRELKKAKAGDTIIIKSGHYKPGNIIIDKPMTLIGEGLPVLDGENKIEIITVLAKDVTIIGLKLINTGVSSMNDFAAIKANTAHRLKVRDNVLVNSFFGIHISNTIGAEIIHNTIYHDQVAEESSIGNGIHLWKSAQAKIENNRVSGHRDGIYFEFVTSSAVKNNYIEKNLRYGLHFMFSHENQYIENKFINNGAGVAVMYTHSIKMIKNIFSQNWGSSSYGMLLKDISDSEVRENQFLNNTVGIHMEGSSRIKFFKNIFQGNGYALRLQASCDNNDFKQNNFQQNTFDVTTNGVTVLNNITGNYWDRYEGYDLNKDGVGDTGYRPVSLYSMIVERVPASILLWRSFMVFLLDRAEKNFPAVIPENLIDNKPSMKPYDLFKKSN